MFDDANAVFALKLAPDRCLALGYRHRWLVKPDPGVASSNPTPCTGIATELREISSAPNRALKLGTRIVYVGSGTLSIADSVDADPVLLQIPNETVLDAAVSGESLLATTSTHGLYRRDGETWKPIALLGAAVLQIAGTEDGHAFATTANDELYASADGGHSWKRMEHDFAAVGRMELAAPFSERSDLVLGGKRTRTFQDKKMVLAENVEVNAFSRVRIRTSPPRGLTDVSGVDLETKRAALEPLMLHRDCSVSDVLPPLAVAACHDEGGPYIVASEDGGKTIREIRRDSKTRTITAVIAGRGSIFVSYRCEQCDGERADVVVRKANGWEDVPVELPARGDVVVPMFDPRRGGAFLFAVQQTVVASESAVFRTEGGVTTKLATLPRFDGGLPSAAALALTTDDNGLGVIGRFPTGDVVPIGYLHYADRSGANIDRRLDPDHELGLSFDVGLAGRKVILFDRPTRLLIASEDAGLTVVTYAPSELQSRGDGVEFAFSEMTCGVAGCDFFGEPNNTVSWRWGRAPFSATLDNPQ